MIFTICFLSTSAIHVNLGFMDQNVDLKKCICFVLTSAIHINSDFMDPTVDLKKCIWFVTTSAIHIKKLSLSHKLWLLNPYTLTTQCRRPQKFQTLYSVRSNNISLKYQRFTHQAAKYIGSRKFEKIFSIFHFDLH